MPNNFTKFDWSRGINVIDQPNMLPDNEIVQARNLFPWGPRGLLSTRPNANYASLLGSTDSAVQGFAYQMGAFTLPMSQGFISLYPTTQWDSNDLSFQSFSFIQDTSASPDVISLGAKGDGTYTAGGLALAFSSGPVFGSWRQGALTQMPICVNYMGKQLWFSSQRTLTSARSESYAALQFIPYSGGSGGYALFSSETLAGTNNSDIRPGGACTYRERLVMWNLKGGYEDCLLFTDNNSMVIGDDALAANSRYVQVGVDGVPIVSCIRVQLDNAVSQATEALLVLKQTGAYLLTSEPNQSWETTEPLGNPRIQVIRFNVDASCISHHTVVQTPYGILWCGVDDVWAFVQGQMPFRLGMKLNPTIRAAALGGYGWRANASYYAGSYRLALPTLPYTAGSTSMLDGYEQYWLELRNGMPPGFQEAAWYGPQVYGTGYWQGALGQESRIEKPGYVYLPTANTYLNSGTKYGIMSAQVDANRSGQDVLASQIPLYARTDNFPLARYISKDYDMGDSMIDKVYTGTELSIQTAHDLMLQVVSDMNTGEDTSLITDILQHNAVNSYVRSLAYAPEGQRPIGPCITIDMFQLAGFLIVAGVNDTFHFREDPGAGNNWRQCAITPGRYSTLAQLMNAIVAEMNTHSQHSRTYTHNAATPRTAVLRITASAGVWDFDTTDTPTMALLALIGFTQTSYTAALYQTAATDVGTAPAYPFDLESAILRTFIIPRRPAV